MTEQFAFGANEIGHTPDSRCGIHWCPYTCNAGCKCPATAAGTGPSHMTLVVEYYDRVLSRESGEPSGVVPEDRAKEVWLEAIDNAYGSTAERKAKEVAKELGWLDD